MPMGWGILSLLCYLLCPHVHAHFLLSPREHLTKTPPTRVLESNLRRRYSPVPYSSSGSVSQVFAPSFLFPLPMYRKTERPCNGWSKLDPRPGYGNENNVTGFCSIFNPLLVLAIFLSRVLSLVMLLLSAPRGQRMRSGDFERHPRRRYAPVRYPCSRSGFSNCFSLFSPNQDSSYRYLTCLVDIKHHPP